MSIVAAVTLTVGMIASSGITASIQKQILSGNVCFVAGTLVLTEEGYKKIEDIEVGDLVWSYDEQTGDSDLKPVVQLFRKVSKHSKTDYDVDNQYFVCVDSV